MVQIMVLGNGAAIDLNEIVLIFTLLFFCISIYHLLTTPNVVDAISQKIVGNPVCKAYIEFSPGQKINFCFFPSQEEITGTLANTMNGFLLFTNGTLDGILTSILTIFSFDFLASIWILLRGVIGVSGLYTVFTFLWRYFSYARSMIPS